MDASSVVTCKALSLACWRTTGEASSIGVPLRFLSTKKIKGTMNREDLERLRKGQQMLNDIDARKSMIEDLNQGIENKDTIKNAVMFVSADYEIRVAMTKEAAVDVMQVVLEKYKQELVELEKQFEEL